MRSSLPPLSLLALLATGCERMPEDPVFLYGRVTHADGSPAAGAPLRLERALDTRSQGPGNPYEQEEYTWEYAPYSEGTSEAEGYFTLEALSGDVYSNAYYSFQQHRFRVSPPLEADGHGVFVAFFFRDDVELPPLRPWASGFTVSDGPEGPRLSFAPAPSVPELPPSAELPIIYQDADMASEPMEPSTPEPVVQLLGEGGLVWQQRQAASPWVPSPYVLEDFSGVEAQVRAASVGQWYFEPLGAQFSDLTFRMEWRSPRVALPAGTRRPVSRGAACSPPPAQGACPYTDGKLATVEFGPPVEPGPGDDGLSPGSLTLTLDAPARPRRMVVRGLETTLVYLERLRVVLEGSGDGVAWSKLADVPVVNFDPEDRLRQGYLYSFTDTDTDSPFDGPLVLFAPPLFLDAPLTGETPVRHVRLRVTAEDGRSLGGLSKLAELSLFE
jgi:hypothetical protein